MFTKLYSKSKELIIKEKYFLIFMILLIITTMIPLPYVIDRAEGTIQINQRFQVKPEKKETGSFRLAYVAELDGTVFSVLLSFIIPNWDLFNEKEIKRKNITMEEMRYQDKMMYEESIQLATMASYKLANKTMTINGNHLYVTDIYEESKTTLKIKDEIIEMDHIPLKSVEHYREIVATHAVGDTISFKVKDEKGSIKSKDIKVIEVNQQKITGIYITTLYEYETSPKLHVKESDEEYGPSGGLMMALSIYNKLIQEDLTKGLKIAGTGTMDGEGEVGSIGGLKYKLLGAKRDKVDVFFVPNGENFQEAMELDQKNHFPFEIIGVSTLSDAINYLKKIYK